MKAIDYYCKIDRERTSLHIASDEMIRHAAEEMSDLFDIMDDYANQRVIEELEDITTINPKYMLRFIHNRIEELKQE